MLSGGISPTIKKIKNMQTATSQAQVLAALKTLKAAHRGSYVAFSNKLESVLTILGARMGVTWTAGEDITDHVTIADFTTAGYSAAEAEAMVFTLTEDCMGQAVNSIEMMDRYFSYEL